VSRVAVAFFWPWLSTINDCNTVTACQKKIFNHPLLCFFCDEATSSNLDDDATFCGSLTQYVRPWSGFEINASQ
jgi:hypothetical protein